MGGVAVGPECDVQRDGGAWANQWVCGMHGVWFRDKGEPEQCPAGEAYQCGLADGRDILAGCRAMREGAKHD